LNNIKDIILKEYPSIKFFDFYLNQDFKDNHNMFNDNYFQADIFTKISRKELSDFIIQHNNNVIMSKNNELIKEKKFIIENLFGYNTPKTKDLTITPLKGTSEEPELLNSFGIYNAWIITSYFLLMEYNIWIKAKLFAERSDYKSSKYKSLEYKDAYYYLIQRQFSMNNFSLDNNDKDQYIIDFSLKVNIYREISEDLLYIILNLLLAIEIIGNKNLIKSLGNEELFLKNLKIILEKNYSKNIEGYNCLYNLRWLACNNYLSKNNIESLYKNINNIN
jgi:hypothetical protein